MAIVHNAAEDGGFIDPPYCTWNRTNAGEPNGSLTPEFVGEIVKDTTNNALWKAIGTANTDWVTLTTPA